jgi:hypothetical protein
MYLTHHFPGQQNSRGGTKPWSSRSPDLSLPDFCLLGHLKSVVCKQISFFMFHLTIHRNLVLYPYPKSINPVPIFAPHFSKFQAKFCNWFIPLMSLNQNFVCISFFPNLAFWVPPYLILLDLIALATLHKKGAFQSQSNTPDSSSEASEFNPQLHTSRFLYSLAQTFTLTNDKTLGM